MHPGEKPSHPSAFGKELLRWREHMQALAKNLAGVAEEAMDEPTVLPLFEEMKTYCLHEAWPWLCEEEGWLAALEQLPEQDKVERLRQQHGELRELIEAFKAELTLENYVGPQTRPGMLWQLLHQARQLLASLQGHLTLQQEVLAELNQGTNPSPARRQASTSS